MRRLFWKEWQERRIWLLLWALAEVGVGVFAHAQPPFGLFRNTSVWMLLPTALALLAGLGAYGSELTGGRAHFLYSRALSWKQVLLAKLLPGLSVLVAAPLITTGILRLCAHAPYTHFMTPANLFSGASWMVLFTGLAYFAGFGCSIVSSGMAGSILVLLGYSGAVFLVMVLHSKVFHYPPILLFLSLTLAPLLGGIIIARFGIMLSPGARVRRFALAVLIPLIIISTAGFLPAIRKTEHRFDQTVSNFPMQIVSRSGGSAFVMRWDSPSRHSYWVDLRHTRLLPLPDNQYFLAWSSNDCLITQTVDSNGKIADGCLLTWLDHGQLRHHRFEFGWPRHPYASPDGRKVLWALDEGLVVYDLPTDMSQSFPVGNISNDGADCWWQSDAVIGYLDPATGRPVLIRLAGQGRSE